MICASTELALSRAMVVVIGLSTLLAAGGARAGDEQKFEDKQMRLAAKDANHGFDELDKVGAKLDKGKQKSAINHFENALLKVSWVRMAYSTSAIDSDKRTASDSI